jgi:hypothetical protein
MPSCVGARSLEARATRTVIAPGVIRPVQSNGSSGVGTTSMPSSSTTWCRLSLRSCQRAAARPPLASLRERVSAVGRASLQGVRLRRGTARGLVGTYQGLIAGPLVRGAVKHLSCQLFVPNRRDLRRVARAKWQRVNSQRGHFGALRAGSGDAPRRAAATLRVGLQRAASPRGPRSIAVSLRAAAPIPRPRATV